MGKISMPQGKGSQLHNRRDYERIGREIPDNIDVSRSADNITIIDKDLRESYKEIFGEALEKYNKKQKRADRKIDDYLDHIQKSKNGEKPFYEDVIQWGTKEDFEKNPEFRKLATQSLAEYVLTFSTYNPNLKIIGAYIHLDEASPHLHLDYIPIAHGFKNGLECRNSLDRAMKEMGYIPESESRKNNATMLWKEAERKRFGDICRAHGLEVEQETPGRGHSFSVEEYKKAKENMLGDLKLEKQALELNVQALKDKAEMYDSYTFRKEPLAKEVKELEQSIAKAEQNLKDVRHQADEEFRLNQNLYLAQHKTLLEAQEEEKRLKAKIIRLEKEIAKYEALKSEIGSLERQVMDLNKIILNAPQKAHFVSLEETNKSYKDYLRSGQLIAIYNDGRSTIVKANGFGGIDTKTLDDRDKGLCKIGFYEQEPQVRLNKSDFDELIENLKQSYHLSKDLERLTSASKNFDEIERS